MAALSWKRLFHEYCGKDDRQVAYYPRNHLQSAVTPVYSSKGGRWELHAGSERVNSADVLTVLAQELSLRPVSGFRPWTLPPRWVTVQSSCPKSKKKVNLMMFPSDVLCAAECCSWLHHSSLIKAKLSVSYPSLWSSMDLHLLLEHDLSSFILHIIPTN